MKLGKRNHTETNQVVEDITRTVLYEGYSLFPYHRGALKNQKPIPFGVVFPEAYTVYNPHAHSCSQTECIITGTEDAVVNITVRFLHLLKTKIENPGNGNSTDKKNSEISPGTGWQTIERKLSSGELSIPRLTKRTKVIPVTFGKLNENKIITYDNINAKQLTVASALDGSILISAACIRNNTYRITVRITNKTSIKYASKKTRDQVLSQSFLSTHTILNVENAEFISSQNPGDAWKNCTDECMNINSWPILIDEHNHTMLSSPIILYDHPKINPQSSGDLFDSTEIEEALLLHVAMLSPGEKRSIAASDEKLNAMLTRVGQVTPEELLQFHSGLKDIYNDQ
jgi:hypothetical protein